MTKQRQENEEPNKKKSGTTKKQQTNDQTNTKNDENITQEWKNMMRKCATTSRMTKKRPKHDNIILLNCPSLRLQKYHKSIGDHE